MWSSNDLATFLIPPKLSSVFALKTVEVAVHTRNKQIITI
jgi:hypothetical protein